MVLLDPINILELRAQFLNDVVETAKLCNWTEEDLKELKQQLLDDVIQVDNKMFDVYEETQDRDLALAAWNSEMEKLRHWLSLSLGIKIKFV